MFSLVWQYVYMRLDIILKVKNLNCVNHIDNATNYNFICNLSKLFIYCVHVCFGSELIQIYVYEQGQLP